MKCLNRQLQQGRPLRQRVLAESAPGLLGRRHVAELADEVLNHAGDHATALNRSSPNRLVDAFDQVVEPLITGITT